MKTLAFTVLHYGKEYLKEAIESVKDHVDKHLIAYSSVPSFGYTTNLKNPDSREELESICKQFDHVIWLDVSGKAKRENVHRDFGINYARDNGFYMILVVDSDEVWDTNRVEEAIKFAYDGDGGNFLMRGTQWVTLWKTFNEYVTDGFAPVRLFNLKNPILKQQYTEKGFIYHMGYCISDELMRYKISIHGHKDDFEHNNKWHTDKWLNYKSGVTKFLHPATEAYWQEAKPFDKHTLPELLKKHSNFYK